MKRRARRNANAPSAGATVSLFPFLAVLICVMGAIIVMLVIVVQQAGARAEAAELAPGTAEARPARTAQELAEEAQALANARAELERRRQIYERSREEARQVLDDGRAQLSHLEDHIRRLEDQAKRLIEQVRQAANRESAAVDERLAAENLARLQAQIDEARNELEHRREAARNRKRSHAVIPYEGPHATQRRPIYIECRGEEIILQPEGIRLVGDDFREPLGAASPLSAALRAVREYWISQGAITIEPYPLLLVRPDGAESYAAARAAMKTWEAEFGYELIESDVDLVYPQPDPQAANAMHRAVEDSRARRRQLELAAPGRYGRPADRVASRNGGFIDAHDGGGGGANERPNGFMMGGNGRREEESHGVGDGQVYGGTGGDRQGKDDPQGQEAEYEPSLERATQSGRHVAGSQGNASGSDAVPVANQRGADWALPNAAKGSTGFTRPISLMCLPDRVVILPEAGTMARGSSHAFHGQTRTALDSLVSGVWKHIEVWGIAGPRAYWKPVLVIEVAPGAEQRFEDLRVLLDNSGFVVERKKS